MVPVSINGATDEHATLEDSMSALVFEIYWRPNNSLDRRSADVSTPLQLKGPPFKSLGRAGWTYNCRVRAKGVRLTDGLTVYVFTAHNEFLGHY